MRVEDLRRFYAEEIQVSSGIISEALFRAFATVPREAFLGPGPWQLGTMDPFTLSSGYWTTPDAEPHWLYHNVVIAIDPGRQLNNGHPGSLAGWINALAPAPGERIVHIGCGVGYYTAILAEMSGRTANVLGIEFDPALAARARANLAPYSNVEVVAGDGASVPLAACHAILANAGFTHPEPQWLTALQPGGRLLLPITFTSGESSLSKGVMVLITRAHNGYAARIVSPVAIYSSQGVRDETANAAVAKALPSFPSANVKSLRLDEHQPSNSCWLHLPACCFSRNPLPG